MQGFRFLLAALQFNFVLLLCYGWGSSPAPRKSQFYMMSSRPSYKDMLKNAQLAKAAQRQNSPTTSNDDRPTAAAISVQPIQEAEEFDDNSDDKSNTNGLPFTDEVYDHLKFVIEKLSGRMRTPRPLSPEDFARFEKSVRAIIYDAVGSKATPQPTVSKTGAVSISSPPQSGKSTPFDEFKGVQSFHFPLDHNLP